MDYHFGHKAAWGTPVGSAIHGDKAHFSITPNPAITAEGAIRIFERINILMLEFDEVWSVKMIYALR